MAAFDVAAYAVADKTSKVAPFTIQRREAGANDVVIEIKFSGVCHSDIHQARDEWGGSIYPMVPGHEIVGLVARVGANVTKFKAGDKVGVGCMVDSCRSCEACEAGEENYCQGGMTGTYNGRERASGAPTYGGYSTHVTVDQAFVLRVPDNIDFAAAAPLLCAGITTYSPLRHWKIKAGDKVGIVGLGGLGHMAVKLAKAMGAHVTVISSSESKREEATTRLGADDFIATRAEGAFKTNQKRFDFILNTISADHDYNAYLGLLKRDATMCLVGVPNPQPLAAFSLVGTRRNLAGSCIGGIKETQEMLDFCGAHNIVSDIELIAMKDINEAYERMIRSDVRYRFVIDIGNTLKA